MVILLTHTMSHQTSVFERCNSSHWSMSHYTRHNQQKN